MGATTWHERLIRRDNDRFSERTVEECTGRDLHVTDHPLSEHKGRGSDRGPPTSAPSRMTPPYASPPGEPDVARHREDMAGDELDKS